MASLPLPASGQAWPGALLKSLFSSVLEAEKGLP